MTIHIWISKRRPISHTYVLNHIRTKSGNVNLNFIIFQHLFKNYLLFSTIILQHNLQNINTSGSSKEGVSNICNQSFATITWKCWLRSGTLTNNSKTRFKRCQLLLPSLSDLQWHCGLCKVHCPEKGICF